ncbi:MAG: putative Ig domain-containing protein [Pirellulales bacterium]|nr:putative Ig domain-containing protein [Pirellulales bacterium]
MSRRNRQSLGLLVVGVGLLLIVAAIAWRVFNKEKRTAALEILPIPNMEVGRQETVEGDITVRASSVPRPTIRFSLERSPPGAQIDARTGRFVWKPDGRRTPGKYDVTVRAAAAGLSSRRSFRITVVARPGDSPRPTGAPPAAPESHLAQHTPLPTAHQNPDEEPGELDVGSLPADVPAPSAVKQPGARQPEVDPGDQVLIDLYKKHTILSKNEYPQIRRVFAERFASAHRNDIRAAFGGPSSPFLQWLDEHPAIKEEFYLAIDPVHDDVPRALELFRKLYEQFPEKFEDYANLAVAVSVVWDRPQGAIHHSPVGQAVLPAQQMGAIENFRYYRENDSLLQGYVRYLPWEFLVFAVNHRTTLPERKWALLNYLPQRAMIGKCYKDVPYDLDSRKGEPQKIAGKLFTLPNQRTYGGVCVCQADFAARAAKSLGVPAFSAGGMSNYGEGHAWVMWVELGQVTRSGFSFSLQSFGRYRDHKYYVGNTADPHTGLPATDRQLELRLHAVGSDPLARRQADLVMRAYPLLREKLELDLPQQLAFLGRVVKSCPGNEDAWKTLASMSRSGQITRANRKPMHIVLDRMFQTFANFPDFTWVVFDDMIYFEDRPRQKTDLYARLAGMYERAGRVDLSCKARLKHADLLAANGQRHDAVDSLAAAILIFPDEGRYVPKLLDKLEALCRDEKNAKQQLAQFYQQFLPKIPRQKGIGPNPYCLAMYKRGIACFQQAGQEQLARAYEAQAKLLEERDFKNIKHGRPVSAVLGQ